MSKTAGSYLADIKDHGGSLSRAEMRYPHAPRPWLDLSTGINQHAYPFEFPGTSAFTRLPEDSRMEELLGAAARAYGVPSTSNIVAAPGTQILLPLTAALVPHGHAAILAPTYAEHQRSVAIAGHQVLEVSSQDDLAVADYAVVVNPNNPDGRQVAPDSLRALANRMRDRGGLLVVDEAFMDVASDGSSIAPHAPKDGAVVFRSFGKFFGLAGIRLGFAIGPEELIARLRQTLGPWAVPGPTIEIGIAALTDRDWQQSMRQRLAEESAALDAVLRQADLEVAGGTSLYRFVRTPDAGALVDALGQAGILIRSFDFDPRALRFGVPGNQTDLERLRNALLACRAKGA